ncbi:MAG: SPOR domain-containing protein [Proteobacteria bacterium]|nr:SPOR domain-containing protein [Pseudomonadota bacterium]
MRFPLPNQELQAPSSVRLIVALTTFVTVLLGAVFLLVGRPVPKVARPDAAAAEDKAASSEAQAAFFYTSVGHAPATLHAKSGDAEQSGKDSFTLEIKVATERDEAERIIDGLHEQGVEAYYTPLARSGRVVYRIRQGLFANQKDADRAAIAVQQRYALATRVVKLQ